MSNILFEKILVPSTGIEITTLPVSETLVNLVQRKVEQDYRARGEQVDPPTYKVKIELPDFTPGTEPEEKEYEHDETTLDQVSADDFLEEADGDIEKAQKLADRQIKNNRRAWAKYLNTINRIEREKREKTSEVMFKRGVLVDLPEDDGWIKAQEDGLGIEVPKNPDDLRLHYLTTEVLITPEDVLLVVQSITKMSMKGMVKPEQVDAAADTFQDILRGRDGQLDEPGKSEGEIRGAMEEIEVAHVDEIHGSASGDEVEGLA